MTLMNCHYKRDSKGLFWCTEGASPASCHSRRSSMLSPRRTLKYRTSPSRSVGSMRRDSPLQRCLTQMGKTGQSIDTIDGLPRSQNDTLCRVDLRKAALLRSILQNRDSVSPREVSPYILTDPIHYSHLAKDLFLGTHVDSFWVDVSYKSSEFRLLVLH